MGLYLLSVFFGRLQFAYLYDGGLYLVVPPRVCLLLWRLMVYGVAVLHFFEFAVCKLAVKVKRETTRPESWRGKREGFIIEAERRVAVILCISYIYIYRGGGLQGDNSLQKGLGYGIV